eukprot:6174785-Pleurochrysis_carterae.AAC.1
MQGWPFSDNLLPHVPGEVERQRRSRAQAQSDEAAQKLELAHVRLAGGGRVEHALPLVDGAQLALVGRVHEQRQRGRVELCADGLEQLPVRPAHVGRHLVDKGDGEGAALATRRQQRGQVGGGVGRER